MSTSTEQFENRLRREQEQSREVKEGKETEMSPEDRLAATKERADYLVKEVKSSKQQMQNILMHMAEVKKAIAAIRKELQLSATGDEVGSLSQDNNRINDLKKRVASYQEEILQMRGDLVKVQIGELRTQNPGTSLEDIEKKAQEMVDALLAEIQNTNKT